jgi:hypothetical protein
MSDHKPIRIADSEPRTQLGSKRIAFHLLHNVLVRKSSPISILQAIRQLGDLIPLFLR